MICKAMTAQEKHGDPFQQIRDRGLDVRFPKGADELASRANDFTAAVLLLVLVSLVLDATAGCDCRRRVAFVALDEERGL